MATIEAAELRLDAKLSMQGRGINLLKKMAGLAIAIDMAIFAKLLQEQLTWTFLCFS